MMTFKVGCVRQVAAGVRQTDVARTQGLSPVLLGRWQRQALAEAVPSSAEHGELSAYAPSSSAWNRSAIC